MDIPSIAQLQNNALVLIQEALSSADTPELSALDVKMSRGNSRVLAFLSAVGIHGCYEYMRDYLAKQAIPITSEGQFLRWWLESFGMSIKSANPAEGVVIVTGTAGAQLPAASDIKSPNGMTYTTDSSVTIPASGSIQVSITAVQGGLIGNVPAGETLSLVNPVVGINGSLTVDTNGINRGSDEEKEQDAIYRLKQRLSSEPASGAPHDYERWALQVAGINRAWAVRNAGGRGSVGVVIMGDPNVNYGIPSAADQSAVLAHLKDPKRAPADEVFVIIPQPVYVDHVIKLEPNTADLRAAIRAELDDLYYREGRPLNPLPVGSLIESVALAAGSARFQIQSPDVSNGGVIAGGQYDIAINRSVLFV